MLKILKYIFEIRLFATIGEDVWHFTMVSFIVVILVLFSYKIIRQIRTRSFFFFLHNLANANCPPQRLPFLFLQFADIMSTFLKFEPRLGTKDLERRCLASFELYGSVSEGELNCKRGLWYFSMIMKWLTLYQRTNNRCSSVIDS